MWWTDLDAVIASSVVLARPNKAVINVVLTVGAVETSIKTVALIAAHTHTHTHTHQRNIYTVIRLSLCGNSH
jgi:hypothetical protein